MKLLIARGIKIQKMLTILLALLLPLMVNAGHADDTTLDITVNMKSVHSMVANNQVTTMEPFDTQGNNFTASPHQQVLFQVFQEPEFQAALKIMTYCSPLLVVFGLIGNTLSLAVTLQKKNRRISCCTYMTALAICDNGSLLTLLYYWFVTVIWPIQWTRQDCVIWVYAVVFMTGGSGFLLVGVTFDRFMAVCFPFRARTWCTPRRARIIVAAILGLVAIFYMPMAAMSNVVDGNVCASFRFDEWPRLNGILAIINLFAAPVIPFIIILMMNIKILRAVHRSRVLKSKAQVLSQSSIKSKSRSLEQKTLALYGTTSNMEEALSKSRHQSKRDRQLTIMLLVVSFTYLIISFPISCRVVAYIFIDPYASARAYAVFVLLFASLNHVFFLNNTLNFYLYCLTGSRFRLDLKKLVCCMYDTRYCSARNGEMQLASSSTSSSTKRRTSSSSKCPTEKIGTTTDTESSQ